MLNKTSLIVGAAAVATVGAGAAAWLLANRPKEMAGQAKATKDDKAAPEAWKRTLVSMEYYAKTPEGGERGFQIDAKVLGGTGFRRIGASWDDAVRAAHTAADAPLSDDIHAQSVNQAQAVLQAADGAYWIAPLGGFHRGTTDGIFIDGAFWEANGVDAIAHAHADDLKGIVGVDHVIDLRDQRVASPTAG